MSAVEVRVPDVGDTEDAEIVEILVSPGDRVEAEDTLLSIESDKATLEIPSPRAGRVGSIDVKVGDRVREGSLLLVLEDVDEVGETDAGGPSGSGSARGEARAAAGSPPTASSSRPEAEASEASPEAEVAAERPRREAPIAPPVDAASPTPGGGRAHASPLVRRQARELGLDLDGTPGSGPLGRVLPEDVKAQVRRLLAGPGTGAHAGTAAAVPQSGYQDVDLTDLEAFRRARADLARERGVHWDLLPFVVKACAHALRGAPFGDRTATGEAGRAGGEPTAPVGVRLPGPGGPVLAVMRDAAVRGLLDLAAELTDLRERVRTGALDPAAPDAAALVVVGPLPPAGHGFTPAPEPPQAAVLGWSEPDRRPRWDPEAAGGQGGFVPRDVATLSLAWHPGRLDAASAAGLTARVAEGLARLETLLL